MSQGGPQLSDLRVGYILKEKQLSTWGRHFFAYCRNAGIYTVDIDFSRPLEEQGPFNVIIQKSLDFYHKYSDAESARHVAALTEYLTMHPETHMLDPLTAVDTVLLRSHLNAALSQPALARLVSAPRYLNVQKEQDVDSLIKTLTENGLKFPMVYKPDHSDGTPESHECAIVFGRQGLLALKAPYILQEYIEHGGQLLKAYTIGKWVDIVMRKSLSSADLAQAKAQGQDPYFFGRISRAPDPPVTSAVAPAAVTTSAELGRMSSSSSANGPNKSATTAVPPSTPKVGDARDVHCDSDDLSVTFDPRALQRQRSALRHMKMGSPYLSDQEFTCLQNYVRELHRVLGLTVMGIDIIRDTSTNTLRVVDINYFPSFKGVSKSVFRYVLLDHLLDVVGHTVSDMNSAEVR